jgi:myo-inositol 2-dehydrogenase/D-chiro-inositol 1-dehydrogenase
MRVGMIGAGYIASRHVDSLLHQVGVRIAGVADPQVDRAQRLADQAGATAYPAWEILLDRERLDAVYVCVPPYGHGAVENAAIDLGVPMFVEKPLALDFVTACGIAERIGNEGLLAAAGYHWRYLDTVEQAVRLLADAPARMVLGAWLDKAPRVPWWPWQNQSGGQTVEQATHLFDVARVLVGEVETGWATATRSGDGPGDIADSCTVAVRFDSGAVGSFANSCLLPGGFRIGLEVVARGLGLRLTETTLTVSDANGERTIERRVDPIRAEDAAFIAAVRGDGDGVRAPYAEAVRTHRLVTAVADAAGRSGTFDLRAPAEAR